MVRWEGGKGGRVVMWKRRESGRWEGWRCLVLFQRGERRVSQRFHLSVSNVNQGNKGARWV